MPSKNYDVVIIGAGAAGLMCAGVPGKRGRNVLLVDHAKSVGDKIRISGGGRCNFTNLFTTAKNFISSNSYFCVSALQRFTQHDFIAMVKKHEIAFHEKTLGQLFCDISSRQIIEMLLKECAEGNVEIELDRKVEEIKKSENIFELKIRNEEINCQSLVIATGGLSIPKMGATAFGYDVARQFGLKIIQTTPALVPFTLDEKMLKETVNLAGVSVDAIVACGKISFREAILFTHRGISGPAILQVSSYWKHGDKITINLAPEIDVFVKIQEEKKSKPKQELSTFLATFLPKSLANYLAQKSGFSGNLADFSNQKLKEIASLVNAFEITPNGTEGYAKAEVTLGGINVDQISSKTFEAKSVPNLFFIGEVLDVTGWLGGFNFQWAWASGKAAGENV
jgi:predicted Rossmann fold flavoprotein